MPPRAASTALALVLAAFLGSALAFALAVRSAPAGDGAWPVTHRNFGDGTCTTCHRR